MADTYYYTVSFSVKDSTGTEIYPQGTSFNLSITDEAKYRIIIWKNGNRLTDITAGTPTATTAMTAVTGSLVTGIFIPPNGASMVTGNSKWSTSGSGINSSWCCTIKASDTALVKALNPIPTDLVKWQDVYQVWHWVPIKGGTVVPTVTFSRAASTAPKVPAGSQLILDLALQQPKNIYTMSGDPVNFTVAPNVEFISPCVGATTSYWISPLMIPITKPPTSIGGHTTFSNTYTYEIRFYNKDGSAGAPADKATSLKEYNQKILSYKSGAHCPSNVAAATAPNPNSNNNLNTSNVPGSITYNPPSNKYTRSEPFYGGASALGYMYQDDSTAAAVNTTGTFNTKWGFRFTYNPTTFSYGTQSSSNLDVTSFAKDPANLVGGTTIVTLQLYLNRIYDFQYLPVSSVGTRDYLNLYPDKEKLGGLRAEDRLGILSRGTEYDLEFLYRIVNGNPRNNLVLGKDSTALSADFGYITGAPFILHLNNNLEYFCSIQTLTVTHAMFTPDMIPMVTVVDLQLMRYPGLDSTTEMSTVNNLISTSASVNQAIATPPKKPKG